MADSNPDTVNLLRTSLARWDKYLREVDELDAVFQEKRNKISDRSRKRLEEFALNPPNDNITILQQALLSDAREIERLEIEHAAMIARKQNLRRKAAEGVAGRILGDLVDILGLPVIQRLAPGLLPLQEEQGATSKLSNKSDCLSTLARPATVVKEGPRPSKYNTRSRTRLCQRTSAAVNIPAAEGEGALKRKRDIDTDADNIRGKKSIRTAPRQPSPRQPTPRRSPPSREATYGSVSSPSPPSVTPNSPHRYSNKDKTTNRKPCTTQQSKDIRFGINGQAARVMVRWDPVRLLWVCAVHIPQGQATLAGLNIMVRRSVIPTFIRLVGQRQVANRLEHLTTASEGSQPSGGCHPSQSSGEEPNKDISNARQN